MKRAIFIVIMTLVIIVSGMTISFSPQTVEAKTQYTYQNVIEKYVKKKGYSGIDSIKQIDKYSKTKWYAYYIYTDGDCYVITVKKGKVDVCTQLN